MLNLVNKSPFERLAMESCLRVAPKGSAIVFLEDGVYAVTKGTAAAAKIQAAAEGSAIYVLGPDLDARGVDRERVMDGVTEIDYGGFVDLVVEHGTPQSWL
ncbi:MAG: sulfurtransferase complex subunit TusB [Rhodobacterales bacterium]|nr:sulfurtransferase complex subunit TusB [Rhodobacterales bacterium]